MRNSAVFAAIILLLALVGFWALTRSNPAPETQPTPVVRPVSSPETVSSPQPSPQSYNDLLLLESPIEGATVSSPLTIRGQARGPWYFEGSFPVVLTNWDGLIIAEGSATAQGEWMTEEYVPFEAVLSFSSDTQVSNRGSLILQKANPSDLPGNDEAFEITVFFE